MSSMHPADWLTSAVDYVCRTGDHSNFKIIKSTGTTVYVLLTQTGEIWKFDCTVERKAFT